MSLSAEVGQIPFSAVTPQHPAIRGRAAVMAWLAKHDVQWVPATNGRQLATVPGGVLGQAVTKVLIAYGPRLLPAWRVGQDVPCDMLACNEVAVVPAAIDGVLCEEHAAQ